MGGSQNLRWLSVAVDRKIEAFFRRLGQLVHRHTYKFLIIPLVLALLGATGLRHLEEEFDPEKLYTPVDVGSPSFNEQAQVEATFGFPAREGLVYAVRSPQGHRSARHAVSP